jgi:hypothetical protein
MAWARSWASRAAGRSPLDFHDILQELNAASSRGEGTSARLAVDALISHGLLEVLPNGVIQDLLSHVTLD